MRRPVKTLLLVSALLMLAACNFSDFDYGNSNSCPHRDQKKPEVIPGMI